MTDKLPPLRCGFRGKNRRGCPERLNRGAHKAD